MRSDEVPARTMVFRLPGQLLNTFTITKTLMPKTLFATHYHELNQLQEDLVRVKNFNVSVKEVGDKIIFMRKLKEGGSEHSFGIHVAQLAGIPNRVVLTGK